MKDTLKIDDDHGIGIKIVIAKVPFIAIIKKVEHTLEEEIILNAVRIGGSPSTIANLQPECVNT